MLLSSPITQVRIQIAQTRLLRNPKEKEEKEKKKKNKSSKKKKFSSSPSLEREREREREKVSRASSTTNLEYRGRRSSSL